MPETNEGHTALVPEFAKGLIEDLRKAKAPVSTEVAESAATAHLMEGKEAAMKVLVAAGVPMVMKQKKFGLAGCAWFDVNGQNIWIG
jgi:hypothetical protein